MLLCALTNIVTLGAYAQEQKKPYWQDVEVVKVNKEYPRTSFMTFDSRNDALSKRFEESKFYQSLNGTWKFYFVDGYKQLPDNITDPSVST
ncbi:MAG: hypothetical protein PHP72_08995, partial [Dysgonamonadaceae bacterium]|nr:hypothetical protein [Dysgonamonadaceae bacterium]